MIDELVGVQLPLIGIKTGDEEEDDAHLEWKENSIKRGSQLN